MGVMLGVPDLCSDPIEASVVLAHRPGCMCVCVCTCVCVRERGVRPFIRSVEMCPNAELSVTQLLVSSEHTVSAAEVSGSRFNFMSCIIQEY